MKLDFGHYLPGRTTGAPLLSFFGRWRHLPAAWLIGVSLAVVAISALLAPSLISAAYLAAGSRALDADSQDRAQVEHAVAALDRARSWSPDDPAIYRALAQAYG